MKKTFIICIALLLMALLTATVTATTSDPHNYAAAYVADITIDGSVSEHQWLMNGSLSGDKSRSFGLLWNTSDLYLAVSRQSGDGVLKLTVNGIAVTVAEDGTVAGLSDAESAVGTVTELRIPWEAVDQRILDYSHSVSLSLKLGDAAWEGSVRLISTERANYTPPFTSKYAAPAESFGREELANGFRMYNKYTESGNGKGRLTNGNTNTQVLSAGTGDFTLEFDFRADAMPVYSPAYLGNGTYACYGFNFYIADSAHDGYAAGITNTADGLVFCLTGLSGEAWKSVKLNRALTDTFHITLDLQKNGDLHLSVDGIPVHVFKNAKFDNAGWGSTKNIIVFSLDSNTVTPTADGSKDTDFTITNIRLGHGYGSSVLDCLTFEDFCGSNTSVDAITEELALPLTVFNEQLGLQELIWISSNPDVITADGFVKEVSADTTVIMTAALKELSSVSKDFTLTVPRMTMDAWLATTAISMDGSLAELNWVDPQVFRATEGDVTGSVSALWKQNNLYLGIAYANANSLRVTLGENSWDVDLTAAISADGLSGTVGSNAVELRLALEKADVQLTDYNQTTDLQIELLGDNGSAKLAEKPVSLTFTGISASRQPWASEGAQDSATYTTNIDSSMIIGDIASFGSTSGVYHYRQKNAAIDHSKDMIFRQHLNIVSLPATAAGFPSAALSARGYYFWISDVDVYNNYGPHLFVNLYNSGTELGLQFRTGATAYQTVMLGKTVGDEVDLEILWTKNDDVLVFVDGALKGTLSDITYTTKGAGLNAIVHNYSGAAAEIYVSDRLLSVVEYTSVAEELCFSRLLPNVNPMHVDSDLMLPDSYDSPYLGTIPLTWASTDASLLSSNGKVTRPIGSIGRFAALCLAAWDQDLWTQDFYIVPTNPYVPASSDILQAAFSGEAITIDGITDEEGWSLNTNIYDSVGARIGRFGVQWDQSNLYLAAETGELPLTVTLDGYEVDLSRAATVDGTTETAVPHERISDYGKQIDAVVEIGSSRWEGTIILTSTDWFITDSTEPRITAAQGGTTCFNGGVAGDGQGAEHTADGWNFYDRYAHDGSTKAYTRTYRLFSNENLADRSKAIVTEFDLLITSMPVYDLGHSTNWSGSYASYGLTWSMANMRSSDGYTESILAGIFNTEDGLIFVLKDDGNTRSVLLNRQVGQLFRVMLRWEVNGDLSLFIDGQLLTVFRNATLSKAGMGEKNLLMNLIRGLDAPQSRNDDLEVYVNNLSIGTSLGDSLMDTLTFDLIAGENTTPYAITSDLLLPDVLSNEQLTDGIGLTWASSDPSVIKADGSVAIPTYGTVVTLTANAADGSSKSFTLYVKGTETDPSVLIVRNDLNPAIGAGVAEDIYPFVLDETNNSIIRDLGETKNVNVIALTDSDQITRLNESVLSIWVSNDNLVYTRVEGFKLLRAGEKTYLYDFEVMGRYIKLHCTHYLGTEADFIGLPSAMMTAYNEDVFGANNGVFSQRTTVTIRNSGSTQYDTVWDVPLTGLANRADIRFYLEDELLYHAYEDGYRVRIPYFETNSTLTLTVIYGNADAMNIANREYLYEVVYGTREAAVMTTPSRWLTTLPDGSLFSVTHTDVKDGNVVLYRYLLWTRSFDGGLSWTEPVPIVCENTDFYNASSSNVVFDPYTGRIIAIGFLQEEDEDGVLRCTLKFFYSDDLGLTWNMSPSPEILGVQANYCLTYSPPVSLSCHDGNGDNVDMVIPTTDVINEQGEFCGRVAYSTDAGLTWIIGPSEIKYDGGEGLYHNEAGVSEGTILERKDGVLVYYARCQYANVDTFARSYSYDQGKTWTAAELSEIYTVNTQPTAYQFGEIPLMIWGGNNTLGGNSYMRFPMSIGAFGEDLLTLTTIQDLYSRYSLQGMTHETMNKVTNPSVTASGDTLSINWWANSGRLGMRIDNFTDYLYRTKGVFDSFEASGLKYEGWSVTIGSAGISDDKASDGSRSMFLKEDSAAARSLPYLQDGSVRLDLYVEANAELTLELESAYSDIFGKTAPIAIRVENGILGGVPLTPNAWNTLVFDLNLSEQTASLTVNGTEAELPLNTFVGSYVCYLDIHAITAGCYVDQVIVQDLDTIIMPGTASQPERFEFAGTTMTLGNDLSLNFMIESDHITGSDWYALIRQGDNITVIPQDEWNTSGGYTRISYRGLAAKEMVDEVVITIYDAENNVLATRTDSAKAYAMRMFGRNENFDTVLADMLNYGAAAQLQFNYKTNDLANKDMTEEQKAKATNRIDLADNRKKEEGYLGTTLELESNIVLNFFFDVSCVGKTASVSYIDHYGVFHSYDVEVATSNGMGKVSADKLVISDCSVAVTVTIDGKSFVDSVESYCARMTNLVLRDPLMKFASSARAYFDQ